MNGMKQFSLPTQPQQVTCWTKLIPKIGRQPRHWRVGLLGSRAGRPDRTWYCLGHERTDDL